MSGLLDRVTGLPVVWVYLLVGLLVFAEDALFVGFVIPGETVAILGGVTANLGRVSVTAMIAIVVVAAVLGDSVGYEVGKHHGVRVLALKPLATSRDRATARRARWRGAGGGAGEPESAPWPARPAPSAQVGSPDYPQWTVRSGRRLTTGPGPGSASGEVASACP